ACCLSPRMTRQVLPLLRLMSIFSAPAVPKFCFQVLAFVLPIVHGVPLFGADPVTTGAAIVKLLSPVSAAPPAALTRKRADVVFGLVTTQAYEPAVPLAFAIEAAIGLHVAPPSRRKGVAHVPAAAVVCEPACARR